MLALTSSVKERVKKVPLSRGFLRSRPKIIRLAALMFDWFSLSQRNVIDRRHEPTKSFVKISCETQTLWRVVAHSWIFSHFNRERTCDSGYSCNPNRIVALAEWCKPCSSGGSEFSGKPGPVRLCREPAAMPYGLTGLVHSDCNHLTRNRRIVRHVAPVAQQQLQGVRARR